MASYFLKLSFLYINILAIYANLSAFDDILDNSKACEDMCTKSYAPHTYPEGTENSACFRGCRLHTITKFVTADEPAHTNTIDDNGLSPASLLCHHSCKEAYNETSNFTTACSAGCDAQEIVSAAKNAEKSKDESNIHLLTPLMQIREVVSKVVGMIRIVQSSITTYFIRDDDSLVAVKGPVEVMVQVVPPTKDELEEIEDSQAELSENSGVVANGRATLECFSRKVGVPPYLLIISLVSFIMFLTYILFVICSTSGKQKKKIAKPMTIPPYAMPVKLVRPEDLTKLSLMDEEEAPALPMKVKLPDNTKI